MLKLCYLFPHLPYFWLSDQQTNKSNSNIDVHNQSSLFSPILLQKIPVIKKRKKEISSIILFIIVFALIKNNDNIIFVLVIWRSTKSKIFSHLHQMKHNSQYSQIYCFWWGQLFYPLHFFFLAFQTILKFIYSISVTHDKKNKRRHL